MPAEIRTKGSNILAVVTVLESVHSLELRNTVLAEMPGQGGDDLRSHALIAAGWYPIAWYRDLLATVVRHSDPSIVRKLGRASTRQNVSTVHRIFMRMISPHTLMTQGARVFSSYFEDATVSVQNVDKQVERILWKGCHGFDKNCWRDQLGSTEELVEMSGAKLLRSRIVSGGEDGDAEMVLEIAWK